jgi:hypothetical protein
MGFYSAFKGLIKRFKILYVTEQKCKVPQSLVLLRVQEILGSNFDLAEGLFQMSTLVSFLSSSRQMSN